MDDHVHALFSPGLHRSSAQLVGSWKGASSRLINQASGRTAPLWQAEYYLRWIASPRLIDICAAYIRANPGRKWPGIVAYPWLLP